MKTVEEIAIEARKILSLIPFAERENINFSTSEYGDPTVHHKAVKVLRERNII